MPAIKIIDGVLDTEELVPLFDKLELAHTWKVTGMDAEKNIDSLVYHLMGRGKGFDDPDIQCGGAIYRCELWVYDNGIITLNNWSKEIIN